MITVFADTLYWVAIVRPGVRDEYARQFNYDLDAVCRDLRERQKKSKNEVVSFPPKRVKPKRPTEP